MVAYLLDTSVVVDLLRKYPPARAWILGQVDVAVSSTVWLEVLDGIQTRLAEISALRTLRGFTRIDPIPVDYDWAITQTIRFKLSHNVGANDCLIAAVSYRLQVPLFTRNLKHFGPMLGTLAQRPY